MRSEVSESLAVQQGRFESKIEPNRRIFSRFDGLQDFNPRGEVSRSVEWSEIERFFTNIEMF
jgi:hypothetical protein